ncbi:cytochrome P450 [Pseudonocardiaceae bacterium YIM PH 21723]|nr:cytochrome P450 [Pseudonocardiaceae bacterium YIM PH 21723]
MSTPVAPGRLPVLGHTIPMARRRFAFTESLRRHGDIVRLYLGPMRTFYIASPELTYQLLTTHGPKFRKGAMYDKAKPFLGNGVIMANGADHLRQRRLLQPAFHRERITAYARTMVEVVSGFVDSWRPGETRQTEADMQSLAAMVVTRALFSTQIRQEDIDAIRHDLFVLLEQLMVRSLLPGVVEKLPLPANRRFDAAASRLRSIVMGVIADWREQGQDRGDQLSLLLLAEDEHTGRRLSDEQVYDEVLTLLSAGIETTAIALAWIFHELSVNPDVEARLHAEVDEVLAGRPLTVEDVPKLTYTAQVVNETLRRYPIWFLMRRALEDVQLGDALIPKGAEVIFSPHGLHHDPGIYPEPERFDPDRWSPERAKDVPRGAFIPFGAGTRQCIGNVFAETEIVIAAATVAQKYRLVPASPEPVRTNYTTAPYPVSIPMIITPRHS